MSLRCSQLECWEVPLFLWGLWGERDEGLSPPGFQVWRGASQTHPNVAKRILPAASGTVGIPLGSGKVVTELLHPKKSIPVCSRMFVRAKSQCGICWENLALNMGILGHSSAVEEPKFGMSSCNHVVPTFWFTPLDTGGLDLPTPIPEPQVSG